ncbi:MAG: MinD/ParA family protein [Pseudolysinimonas sp.]|uniref:MinD/ParA family ATP-binding protein n=1 Tax=Pseudolysinimonas sp. TaxID=2680009 RepID=UPI003264373A
MRSDPDDDLAAALPSSLTADLRVAQPIHETPVADEVAPTTVSIQVVTSVAEDSSDDDATLPTDDDEPVAIVPLPAPAEAATGNGSKRAEPKKPKKPTKAGRAPAPEGLVPEVVYAATLHLVNIGDSVPVRTRKALDARIAKPLVGGPRFVPIISRKGGVGTTTITALLGMALADVRTDRVLAIDANPDRGTLVDRVPPQSHATVRDIVLQAPKLGDYDNFARHVVRDATGLSVAASDTDPLLATPLGDGDYNVIADVAGPHHAVILTDTGTGIMQPVVRAALLRADAVIVVSGGSLDEARLASEMLTWLEANGNGDLVANAVVALNASTQGTDLDKLEEIDNHFLSRVRAVVRIPYDPELAAGSVIRYEALRPFTRDSARDLAAVTMDGLQSERGA